MNVYFFAGFGAHRRRRLPGAAPPALRLLGPALVASLVLTFLPFHFDHEPVAPVPQLVLVRPARLPGAALGDAVARAVPRRPRPAVGPDAVGDARVERAPQPAPAAGRSPWSSCACCSAGTETMTTCFTLVLLALTGLIGAAPPPRAGPPARERRARSACSRSPSSCCCTRRSTTSARTATTSWPPAGRSTEQERYGLEDLADGAARPGATATTTLARLGRPMRRRTRRSRREGGQALDLLGTARLPRRALPADHPRVGPARAGTPLRAAPGDTIGEPVLDNGALVILLATLLGTIGGFAIVISLAGFSQIRVWNRVVLMIAFFAFVFAADLVRPCSIEPHHEGSLTWPAPFVGRPRPRGRRLRAVGRGHAAATRLRRRWTATSRATGRSSRRSSGPSPTARRCSSSRSCAFPEEPPFGRDARLRPAAALPPVRRLAPTGATGRSRAGPTPTGSG